VADDELRRKLLRNQLLELVFTLVAVGIVSCLAFGLIRSVVLEGSVTLYAGGRGGPKRQVVLTLTELPLGVAGVALIFIAAAFAALRLLAGPAYHVVRTALPSSALPRVPRSVWVRKISTGHFLAALAVAAVGVVLVVTQYLLLHWQQ
jgi:hypothetical protein